mmetsp:Transcript_24809/g.22530  ORF Transcript_24809/g.22530 Transcript_24809/m.22530 type:complete len:251 (+) Transcript_24809:11-763(+)
MSSSSSVDSVSQAYTESNKSSIWLRYSFIVSVGIYVILLFLPAIRSKKSFWDTIAAKKVIFILRIVVSLELLSLIILLIFTIFYGSPLALHYSWVLSNGVSWLYSYPRPITGIISIGCGLISDMHFGLRYICILGCILQFISDSVSATQVYNYYIQVLSNKASGGQYNENSLYAYFIRDILSFGLSFLILLLSIHFLILTGLYGKPLITYSSIHGGDFDRCEVMRTQRKMRKYGEKIVDIEKNDIIENDE